MIYLYVKTHNKTGMKYLGKTTKDPHSYKGSGVYWLLHIKKHGNDVTTEIIKECVNDVELKEYGEYYSKQWNVVTSNEWANLKDECGDGGDTSMTEGFKNGIKNSTHNKKKRSWWNDGIYEKHCENKPNEQWILGRLPRNNDHNFGRTYWNNGEISIMSITKPDDGWVKGMLKNPNERWWTNGCTSKRAENSPGIEWILGCHKKGKRWTDGKSVKISENCPGDGWKLGSIPTVTGKKWWTNGHSVVFQEMCPTPEWWNGRK